MYVDTSVIVAMLTDEPKTQACKNWFSGLKQAPMSGDWLVTEFYSAIALKQRTGQLREKDVKATLHQFEHLTNNGGIKLMPIARETFAKAGKLTHQHTNTRAGDALHLSVAMQCEAKVFVTLDNTQAASAKQLGFDGVTI